MSNQASIQQFHRNLDHLDIHDDLWLPYKDPLVDTLQGIELQFVSDVSKTITAKYQAIMAKTVFPICRKPKFWSRTRHMASICLFTRPT